MLSVWVQGLSFWRQRSLMVVPFIFFLIIVAFFPLGWPAGAPSLVRFVPGIIWLAVMLSLLLAMPLLFQIDYESGVLNEWLISGASFNTLVWQKIAAYWCLGCLPMVIIGPLLAGLYGLNGHQIGVLFLSLLLGTPALCVLGALGAAMVMGLSQASLLMPLIVLPLQVPLLVFGASAVERLQVYLSAEPALLFLAAITVFICSLVPFFVSMVIKERVRG